MMKQWLLKTLPILGRAKAVAQAWWQRLSPRRASYSQGGEDVIVLQLCQGNLPEGPYVDIGANHPTRLSNTYLFYRMGKTGIAIDPATHLLKLHRMVRPHDKTLAVACGESPGVLEFRHAYTDVLSGFDSAGLKPSRVRQIEWVPVLPIDDILSIMLKDELFLVSIDVEGFDREVVRGGAKTLARSRFLIIEGSANDRELLKLVHDSGHVLQAATKHNLIFMNTRLDK